MRNETQLIQNLISFNKCWVSFLNPAYSKFRKSVNRIMKDAGDCLDVLNTFQDNFFDLIVTSPPYADSRSKTYGGIRPDKYVEWFPPRTEQFLRVLKPDGTFILNIKEKAINGERHTYVIELILEMKKPGWFWTEEFVWHKKSCYPGKWPNRFRDAWERCLRIVVALTL